MKYLAREKSYEWILSLAFFMFIFFILGCYYGEATDSFWVDMFFRSQRELPKGFFVGIGGGFELLYAYVPNIPWFQSFMLLQLLGVTLLISRGLKLGYVFTLLLLLFIGDVILLFDFTEISLVTGSMAVFYIARSKKVDAFTIISFMILMLSFLVRFSNAYLWTVLLVPLAALFPKSYYVKLIGCILFVMCILSTFQKKSELGDKSSRLKKARVSLVDYDWVVDSTVPKRDVELVRTGLWYHEDWSEDRVKRIEQGISKWSLESDKVYRSIVGAGKKLYKSYPLLLVVIGLVFMLMKGKRKWFMLGYYLLILFSFAIWLKLPDRILLPILTSVFLTTIPLVLSDLNKFKYVVLVLSLIGVVRLSYKANNVKQVANSSQKTLKSIASNSLVYSFGNGGQIMHLEAFSQPENKLLPLGGWLGFKAFRNENCLFWINDPDKLPFNRELMLTSHPSLYKRKKASR